MNVTFEAATRWFEICGFENPKMRAWSEGTHGITNIFMRNGAEGFFHVNENNEAVIKDEPYPEMVGWFRMDDIGRVSLFHPQTEISYTTPDEVAKAIIQLDVLLGLREQAEE